MLVQLLNKQVAEKWDLFKDVLRSSVPTTPDMLPNWLTECLYLAMCGRVQCWVGIDPSVNRDAIYTAFLTRKITDELTGQTALLIYALKVYFRASREERVKDLQTLAKIASEMGAKRITAYCLSRVTVNALKKAFPDLEEVTYVSIPIKE